MNLKFELKKENGHTDCILTVQVDEESCKMLSFQTSDSEMEMQLKKGGNLARLRSLVESVANGTICSERLEIKSHGESYFYNLEQLSGKI